MSIKTESPSVPPTPSGSAGILRNRAFDGFRGFAMLILMVAHFGAADLFPGAWLGINFFLVFSGYIIVTLMLVEKNKTGRINIEKFYRRRAKRLLPALFLLMTVVGLWALFFAENFIRRGMKGDILATLGYVMNWRLIVTSDDYFAQSGVPSFFRHAWTLGIEEQFYIAAPIIVILVLRYTRSRWVRIGIMLALASISAYIAAQVGASTPSALTHAYYGTDTRAQAIFIGIAFAFFLGPDDQNREIIFPSNILLKTLGWIAVIVNVWFYTWVKPTDAWVFENWGIFWISLSTLPAFIVVAREPPTNTMKRVFSNPFFVLMGLMTYGLYLWHWPVQLWMKIYAPDMGTVGQLIVGSLATTAIAFVSFRWMEVKIILRGLNAFAGNRRRARMLIWVSLIGIISIAFALGSGDREVPKLIPGTAEYVAKSETTSVAVFGDSTARYFFDDMPEDVYSDIKVTNLSVDGCHLIMLGIKWGFNEVREPEEKCFKARDRLTEDLKTADPDVFVLMPGAATSMEHVTEDGKVIDPGLLEFRTVVERELESVRHSAVEAGIDDMRVVTIPCRENDMGKLEVGGVDLEPYFRENAEKAYQITDPVIVNAWIEDWAQANGVGVIDLYGALDCSDAYQRKINGVTLYRDWFHFSEDASAMIWSWLAPVIRDGASE